MHDVPWHDNKPFYKLFLIKNYNIYQHYATEK